MRTARLLPVPPCMHCSGGVPGPGGCTWSQGGVPAQGGKVPGPRGVYLRGVPAQAPPCEQNDRQV